MAPTPTRRCHLGCGSVLLIIAIGFSCAELAIFVTGKYHPLPQSTQCPNLNLNATAGVFKLQKQLLSQWHWSYSLLGSPSGYVEQRCPSLTFDSEFHINGQVAGRTDGKIASIVSQTYILDCHGNRTHITKTGNPWQQLINGLEMKVAYVIYTANAVPVAFVDGTTFLVDNFDILDATDKSVVANLYRDKKTLSSWTWIITVSQPNHPAGNPVLLGLLAGQRSFFDSGGSTDICNSFFQDVGYVIIAVLALVVLLLALLVYTLCCVMRSSSALGMGEMGVVAYDALK